MENLEKVVYINRNKIKQELKDLERKAEYIQNIVDDYNDLGLGKLEHGELIDLFHKTKVFLSKKITGDNDLKIGNITAKPEKLYDVIEKPKGTEKLVALIEKHNSDRFKVSNYRLDRYVVEKGVVLICPNRKKQIEDFNTVKISNQKQSDVYEASLLIVQGMNKLKTLLGGRLTIEYFEKDVIRREAQKANQPYLEDADFAVNPNIINKFK
jgi:hypothetical protein